MSGLEHAQGHLVATTEDHKVFQSLGFESHDAAQRALPASQSTERSTGCSRNTGFLKA